MLKLGVAILAATFIVPIEEVKQPPEAPPVGGYAAINPLKPPPFPWMAKDSPPAPQAIVLVSCRTDDLTGRAHNPQDGTAPHNYRDLEPHVVNGELQCKRVEVELQDASLYSPAATADMKPLNANFGRPDQCARAGVMFASNYDEEGWSVVALGCPTPITDQTGKIVGWKMPECPNKIGGMEGIRCKFDESVI